MKSGFLKNIKLGDVCSRIIFFALFWVVLNGKDADAVSWTIGIPFIVLATYITQQISLVTGSSYSPLNIKAFIKFMPFFVKQSIIGGIETAQRALTPQRVIQPAFYSYDFKLLQTRSEKIFFVNLINLLPGTLTAQFSDEAVLIHVLDMNNFRKSDIFNCEEMVRKIFHKIND